MGERVERIIRGAFVVSISSVASIIFSGIALAVNLRALSVEDFGRLAVFQAYLSFISGLTTFDIWQPIVRLGLRYPKRLGLLLGTGFALDLTASLFAAASAAIGLVIFSNVIGVDGVSLFALIVGCLSLIAGVAGTPKGYFRLKGRFAVLALNQTIGSFLTLCGSLALWQAEANISSYVIVLCLLNALPPVMLLARMVASAKQNRVMIESPLKPGLRRRFLRLVARLSVGNSILSIVLTSRYQISLFIVSSLLGSSSAGLFAAASRCANVFSRALSPIVQVLFPELAREMASTGGTRLRMPGSFLSAIFLLCVVLSSVGAVLFGPEILRAAAGDEFAAAGHAFGFLFATELAMFCSAVISAIVLHMYGQKRLVLLGVTAASISHLSSLSVARSLGIEGVSLSLLVGALLSLTVSGFLVHRGFLNRT